MKRILYSASVLLLILSSQSLADEAIKDGVKKEYYPSGKIESEQSYRNGKQDGTGLSYYEDGKFSGEWYWKDGIFLGYKSFYPDGKISQEVVRSNDGNVQQSVKDYYENGQLLLEQKEQENRMFMKRYYPDGQLQEDGVYVLRKTNRKDVTTKDPETGKIRVGVKSFFWDAVERKIYDEEGNIFENGIYKTYSKKGRVISEVPYINGKMNGIGKEYYDDGKVSAEIVFSNDDEISRKEFDESGSLKILVDPKN